MDMATVMGIHMEDMDTAAAIHIRTMVDITDPPFTSGQDSTGLTDTVFTIRTATIAIIGIGTEPLRELRFLNRRV